MNKPLISVVIINYNQAKFLRDAIESALNQITPLEWEKEILIIDDGSTDDSHEVAKLYLDRVRWITKQNGGQVSVVNRGFQEARGKYISLLEADDIWTFTKLLESIGTLRNNDSAVMIQHWLKQVDTQDNPLPGYIYPNGPREFSLKSTLYGLPLAGTSALVFRKDALKPFFPLPEALYGADLMIRAIAGTIGPILNIPDCLGLRRIHGKNLFGESLYDDSEKLEKGIKVHKQLIDFYKTMLDRQGIPQDEKFFQYSNLELIQYEMFLFRYRGRIEMAIKQWFKIVWASGIRRYSFFKGTTLLLALISPRLYLRTHKAYREWGLAKKLRFYIFPFGERNSI